MIDIIRICRIRTDSNGFERISPDSRSVSFFFFFASSYIIIVIFVANRKRGKKKKFREQHDLLVCQKVSLSSYDSIETPSIIDRDILLRYFPVSTASTIQVSTIDKINNKTTSKTVNGETAETGKTDKRTNISSHPPDFLKGERRGG